MFHMYCQCFDTLFCTIYFGSFIADLWFSLLLVTNYYETANYRVSQRKSVVKFNLN